MTYHRIFLALLGLTCVSACSTQPTRTMSITPASVEVSANKPTMLSLESTQWQLDSLGGSAPQATNRVISLFLAQGKVSGFGGCNLFNGRYTFDNERFVFSQLAAASFPCPASAQEKDLFGALEQAGFWHIDQKARRLSLFDNGGQKLSEWKVVGR